MNTVKFLLQILFLTYSIFTFSQSMNTVHSEKGEPLNGVHVLNQSTGEHAHTNKLGGFQLPMTEGDTLFASHIGYTSSAYNVSDEGSVTIILQEAILNLDEVVVSPRMDALDILTSINIMTNPVNSSQEILRKVPGLVIGQHAGGGKAEQIFLRGFDIDHGTDINITVDGMPVNMVSHAHGQGYADLHFVIPETIDNLNFGKGPYYADQGNFATAGFVALKTKNQLKNNLMKLEVGQFDSQRFLGMLQVLNQEKHKAYLATEYQLTDGPFDSPQNFNRLNVMTKYSGQLSASEYLEISGSHFTSTWNASGQIPQRAIDNGLIDRFGAIDDAEGGQTSRSNFTLAYTRTLKPLTFISNRFYYSHYEFELYSNFTFFLEDPVNGDQIKQKENRNLFGLKSEFNHSFHLGVFDGNITSAVGFRSDMSYSNELSHTKNRSTTLDTIQLGDIQETNVFTYTNLSLELGKWVFNPGLRLDRFDFNYTDFLLPYATQETQKAILSPKFNILYNTSNRLQLYLKSGKGFHSNDTRLITGNVRNNILPAAWGNDLGLIAKPTRATVVNMAVWHLYSEQEFVYVGDAGIVEPSGKSRRMGVDFSLRHQPISWFYWDVDINHTIARAMEEPEGNNFIPLAPDFTIMSGANVIHPSGVYGGARLRFVDHRPANEDNSIVAKGYSIIDVNAGYQWKNLDFSISIQNLFNQEWNETQFATESRLANETEPVEEIHFTPGTPFFAKGAITYKF
ncbi:TonB-dependent receptor [Marinoscillum sp.]|uniref:TonB-dependent receptor n=1 Tax=Marinoscillum sp. TaxID=2024838 RepID=UPI003BA874D8